MLMYDILDFTCRAQVQDCLRLRSCKDLLKKLLLRMHVQVQTHKVVLRSEPIANTTQYTNGLVFETRTLDLSGCRSGPPRNFQVN